jgi:hypothetical protein
MSAGQLWRDHDGLLWVEIQTAAVEPSGWRLMVPLVDADQGSLSPAAGGPDRPLASPRPPHHGRPRQRPRRTRRPPQRYPARGPARRARSVYRPALLATPGGIVCCGGGPCQDVKALPSRAGGTPVFVATSPGSLN